MGELTGINCQISIGGAPVHMIGDATTADGTSKIYTITTVAHRVLATTLPVVVYKKRTPNLQTITGTTTTTVKATGHGLVTGDLIVNISRSNAARIITRVDNDTFTVAAITGQAVGDYFEPCPIEPTANYVVNYAKGTITYATADMGRVIRVTADYVPLTVAAYANKSSHSREAGILDVTPFGATHKKRIAGLKNASGTLSQFNIADTTFTDALTAGVPVMLEYNENVTGGGEPTRFWALLESSEVEAAIEDVQNNTVSWISHDAWIRLGV